MGLENVEKETDNTVNSDNTSDRQENQVEIINGNAILDESDNMQACYDKLKELSLDDGCVQNDIN